MVSSSLSLRIQLAQPSRDANLHNTEGDFLSGLRNFFFSVIITVQVVQVGFKRQPDWKYGCRSGVDNAIN